MTAIEQAEIRRLTNLTEVLQLTLLQQSRKYSKLTITAQAVINQAKWSGEYYLSTRMAFDQLRAALESLPWEIPSK